MELELARRRAAFMRRYAGGGEDDSSDEGEGEEYEMDLDDDQEPLVKGKEKQQPAAVANTNEDLNWEKQRKDEEEDDEEEEREEREEEARRAKAKRDWQRWFAKPPALVDLVVRHRRAALAHRVSALFAAGNWEGACMTPALVSCYVSCVSCVEHHTSRVVCTNSVVHRAEASLRVAARHARVREHRARGLLRGD